jgi:DNA polymerase-3 subunit gamma/tau
VCKLVEAIAKSDYDAVFSAVASVVSSARDISVFWQDIISLYRDMLVLKTSSKPTEYLDLTDSEYARIKTVAAAFSKEKLVYHISVLNEAFALMQKANAIKRLVAETALVKMCDEAMSTTPDAMLLRISNLEDRINSGAVSFEKCEAKETSKKETADKPKAEKSSADIIKEIKNAAQKTAPAAAKSVGVLKPFREFAEVIERVGRQDVMVASFLKGARAYTDGERIVIRVEKEFTLMMLDRGNNKDIVRGAISAQLKRNVDDRCIVYECSTEEIVDDASGLDEITNALN